MTTGTKVGVVLCAAHRGENGRVHGHTWVVWATFADSDACAVELQHQLAGVLAPFEHDELPAQFARAEALAKHVGLTLPGCTAVDIERPVERLAAWWRP